MKYYISTLALFLTLAAGFTLAQEHTLCDDSGEVCGDVDFPWVMPIETSWTLRYVFDKPSDVMVSWPNMEVRAIEILELPMLVAQLRIEIEELKADRDALAAQINRLRGLHLRLWIEHQEAERGRLAGWFGDAAIPFSPPMLPTFPEPWGWRE